MTGRTMISNRSASRRRRRGPLVLSLLLCAACLQALRFPTFVGQPSLTEQRAAGGLSQHVFDGHLSSIRSPGWHQRQQSSVVRTARGGGLISWLRGRGWRGKKVPEAEAEAPAVAPEPEPEEEAPEPSQEKSAEGTEEAPSAQEDTEAAQAPATDAATAAEAAAAAAADAKPVAAADVTPPAEVKPAAEAATKATLTTDAASAVAEPAPVPDAATPAASDKPAAPATPAVAAPAPVPDAATPAASDKPASRTAEKTKEAASAKATGQDSEAMEKLLETEDDVKVKQLRSAFDSFDLDGSGKIDRQELESAAKRLGKSNEQIGALLTKFSQRGDNEIDFKEFQKIIKELEEQCDVTEEEECFKLEDPSTWGKVFEFNFN